MSGLRGRVRRHPLAAYWVLAIALSWSYWVPDALDGGTWTHFPGLVGPAVAALLVSLACGDGQPVALWRRVTTWRVPVRWYLAAAVPMAAAPASVGARWLAGSPPEGRASRMPGVVDVGWLGVVVLVFIVNGFGEEVGWRGFAWPELRRRRSLPQAALLLTVPWALWHAPLFWIDTGLADVSPLVLPGWLLGLACGAMVLGWLMERSGSVAVVALAHTMLNMATATDATKVAAPFASAAVIVWAIWIGRRAAPVERARGERRWLSTRGLPRPS